MLPLSCDGRDALRVLYANAMRVTTSYVYSDTMWDTGTPPPGTRRYNVSNGGLEFRSGGGDILTHQPSHAGTGRQSRNLMATGMCLQEAC